VPADEAAGEVRAHLAACEACRTEAGALVTTGALLAAATPDDVRAPEAARERILRSVRETGMVRRPSTSRTVASAPAARSRWRFVPALASVALAAVLVGGLVMVVNMGHQRDSARADVTALAELASASGHILARPDHAQLSLTGTDGTSTGMVVFSPSSGQVAVWSRGLAGSDTGTRYDCYLARGAVLTLIGWMDAAGNVDYWVGQVPAGITLGHPGDRIVVQADTPGAAPVLSGTF
ncbi:MAG TPA: hypothetical protein VN771_08635, partial [Candidatus Baltobacteraceae bacterium]|nr:hypothetical protein [Candidatus Baltobacteraceae bacterium]